MPNVRPEVASKRRQLAIELGQRIAVTRRAAGLSQQGLAVSVGMTQQALARIEQGQRAVSFTEGLDLAAALGLAPTALDPRLENASETGPPRDH